MDRVSPRIRPEEDFIGKYTNANRIHRRLLDGYFAAVRDLVKRIPAAELRTALEVGCGVGYSTERLRDIIPPQARLEASEYLDWQVTAARERLPDTRVVQEDIYRLRRRDQSLDLVFALEVLEHLEDDSAALRELHRVARYVIIGVPHEPWWRILNMARGKYLRALGNTPGHVNHWSGGGLVRLLSQNAFSVIAKKSPLPWTIVLAKRNG